MKNRLERRYGRGHLHFITCSCYHREPFLATHRVRNLFLKILGEVRDSYGFALWGYAVMPEHIHLLISEPEHGTPSTVMQVLKQRVARAVRQRRVRKTSSGQMVLWEGVPMKRHACFWQRRFYDFNVLSSRKRNEKLNYMHFNPVKRGLVRHPKDWLWKSYRFYASGEGWICAPNPGWPTGRLTVGSKEEKRVHSTSIQNRS